MKRPLLLIIGLLTVIAIISCFNRNRIVRETSTNKTSLLSSDDILIKRFKDTAQAHIDYLIEFMGEHDKGDTLFRYFIKSNFFENGFNEHMWSQVYKFENGFFIGTLGNDPIHIKKLKFNDMVKIPKQDVEDWILQDFLTNTQVGSYSRDYLHKTSQ